jgi:hypothetical protein
MAAGLRVACALRRAAAVDPWCSEEALPGPDGRDDDSVGGYLREV